MATFEIVAYRPLEGVTYDPNNPQTWPQRKTFTRVAARPELACDDLIAEGYEIAAHPRKVERVQTWRPRFRQEKALLYAHLSRLVARNVARKRFAKILANIFDESNRFYRPCRDFLAACGTKDFYRAMEAQSNIFEEYEVNLLQIAAGGKESEMFHILSESLKVENKLGQRMAVVLSWPIVVGVAFVIFVGLFLFRLLHKLVEAMQAGSDTPDDIETTLNKMVFPLKHLYHFSIWLENPIHDVGLVIALLMCAGAVVLALRYSYYVRFAVDYITMYYTRSFGKIIRISRETKLLQVLVLLLEGNQQSNAYEIARSSAVGQIAVTGMGRAAESFEHGGAWTSHLRHCKVFPADHVGRMEAAEETSGYPGIKEELYAIIGENGEDQKNYIDRFERELLAFTGIGMGLLLFAFFSVSIFPLQHQITLIK